MRYLARQQRPAQQAALGDRFGPMRITSERAEGEPDTDGLHFDAARRSPGPGRAEEHQRARPAASSEFDSDPAAEGVAGDVHLLQAQLVELVFQGVNKGLN